MHGFWVAVGFLTRLPIPATPYNEGTVGASLVWYPVVGALVGLLVAVAAGGAAMLFPASPLLTGVITVTVWVALTGALHLDGLADTLDAWVGGLGDRERTLAIMKDPHVGSTALVWMVLFLLAKVASVSTLLKAGSGDAAGSILMNAPLAAGLILCAAVARLMPPWLFQTTPYVRAQGLGNALQDALSPQRLYALTAGVILVGAGCFPLQVVLALTVACAVLFLACRRWMTHRLGGTTGDTAGALIELTELTILLTLVATTQ